MDKRRDEEEMRHFDKPAISPGYRKAIIEPSKGEGGGNMIETSIVSIQKELNPVSTSK